MNYYQWQSYMGDRGIVDPDHASLIVKNRGAFSLAEHPRLHPGVLAKKVTEMSAQTRLWLLGGRPFYNVHPQLVGALCRTNLKAIPASFLEVPGGFHAVDIRLCQESPELSIKPGEFFVQSILFAWAINGYLANSSLKDFDLIGRAGRIPRDRSVAIYLNCGPIPGTNGEGWNYASLLIPTADERNLEKVIEDEGTTTLDLRVAGGSEEQWRRMAINAIRLVASVGFLANSSDDDLVQADVLAKDRAKFRDGDEDARRIIIERARRRNKVGWNIGTNEMFVGERPVGAHQEPMGKWEHRFAHIRSGHSHAVRFGKDRKQVKIKWFRPTVVRRDLPFDSGEHPGISERGAS